MTIIRDRILPLRRALMSLAIHFFLATRVCASIVVGCGVLTPRREGHSDTGKKDDHTRRGGPWNSRKASIWFKEGINEYFPVEFTLAILHQELAMNCGAQPSNNVLHATGC